MSVETDPIPPVPEHTPPIKEDETARSPGRMFNQAWTRWFVSVREKVNVISESLVNLGNVSGSGFISKNGAAWLTRIIQGTSGRVNVTNGNGAAGNPVIDVVTGDLVAGTNVSFSGSGTGRLIGSASLTINATGGGGGGTPFVPPPESGWAWVNQGTATLSSTPDRQVISGGEAGYGLQMRGRVRALPSAPYVVTAYLEFCMVGKNYQTAGMAWRSSATGRLVGAVINVTQPAIQVYKANSPTSYNADYAAYGAPARDRLWFRLADDGTNRSVSVSVDGENFLLVHSVANTDFLVADEIGFFTNCENTTSPQFAPIAVLRSWDVS